MNTITTGAPKPNVYEPKLFASLREVQRFAGKMQKSSDPAERERGKRIAELAARATRRGAAAEAQLLETLNSHALMPADLDGGFRTRLVSTGM